MSLRSLIRSRFLGAFLGIAFVVPSLLGVPSVAAAAGPTFTFHGAGYGHGIGMSQYGAYGYAIHGSTYGEILRHYYTGTTVDRISDITAEARVNLDPDFTGSSYTGAASWTMRGYETRLKVWDSSATRYFSAGTNMTFTYNGSLDRVEVRYASAAAGTPAEAVFYHDVWVAPETPNYKIQVNDRSGGHDTTLVRYRGKMALVPHGSASLDLINYLPIQQYLWGVVPREMPSSWSTEALKVQAVAARCYGYSKIMAGQILKCTTYDQVYCGYGYTNSSGQWVGEMAATNAAVDTTDDVVVRYNGSVVVTYFSSQSGGHTANIEDVWVPADGDLEAKAAQYPYLRGVIDPYETDAGATYVPWTGSSEKSFDGSTLADKLRSAGLSGVPASPQYVTAVAIEAAESGHARYVTFAFSGGGTVKTTGDKVRSVLGLRSTLFWVGPPYARVYGADRYATSVEVSKKAFPLTAPAVVLASGEDYPDALCGTGLAGAKSGSLLLVTKNSVPTVVGAELTRLRPSVVYVMGGTSVIGQGVLDAVKAKLPSASIVRVAGHDRYGTSLAAARLMGSPSTAVVVSGSSWPDAVSASGLAYATDAPMLLTPGGSLGAEAAGFLAEKKPAKTLLIGGTVVLDEGMEADVKACTGVAPVRLSGADRYSTSAKVGGYVMTKLAFTDEEPLFASGETYADALSAGPLSGSSKRVLLLTGCDTCWPGTASAIEDLDTPDKIWVVGGPAAVSSKGVVSLQIAYLGN